MMRSLMKKAAPIVAVLAVAALLTTAQAFEPKVVTFGNGEEGWVPRGDCGSVIPEGGNPGAYWNVVSQLGDGSSYILQGWSVIRHDTAKGPVRLGVDVNVNDFTYYWFQTPVRRAGGGFVGTPRGSARRSG